MADVRLVSASDLSREHKRRLLAHAEQDGKAVLAGPVFDTIKRVEDGLVVETIDRDTLRWPLAWAYTADNEPPSDPPPAEWFAGATVIE